MTNLGLPEGVEIIDYGQATEKDYDLSRGPDGEFHIYLGKPLGGGGSMRVRPGNGYEFVQVGIEERVDPRQLQMVQGRPRFACVKKLEPQRFHVFVHFTVTNQIQADAIREKYAELRQLAGFDGLASSITSEAAVPQPKA